MDEHARSSPRNARPALTDLHRRKPAWIRKTLSVAAALLATGAAGATPACAGAWTLEQGTGQAIVGGLFSAADQAFDEGGGTTDRPAFRKGAVGALVEYGVRDWLTLTGEGEFGSQSEANAPFARPALGHAGLGGRVRLFEGGGFVASAAIAARIADAHGAADEAIDTFGWSEPELDAKALAGYGFDVNGYAAFLDAGAGYRHRTGDGPDEVKVDLTIGIRPRPDLLLMAQSFSTISANEPEVLAGGYDYHKAQLSGVYDLNETWSVQAGAFATVAGTNALAERGLLTALWFRF